MRSVTLAATAASASGKLSDDCWGMVGDAQHGAAWVLDGATDLGDRVYFPGAHSDASWYAQALSSALETYSLSTTTPNEVFSLAITQVTKQWEENVGHETIPRFAHPSAAGVWVRWQNDVLEFTSLCDCRGWHAGADGTLTQLGLLDEKTNDAWVIAGVQKQQSAGITASQMHDVMLDEIRARRSLMNTTEGYWVFGIHAEATQHLQTRTLPLSPGHIVLCSDGLFRWVDTYFQGDVSSFVQNCITDIGEILTQVRSIERHDADCKTYPRLKGMDDATGIVLRIENA